ncbi:MAG: hypothetical protein A3I71_01880 [Omnitrophica WOR_2 bacterium RIFCSPLOWO2_02_FULL_63_16]|nr:MAG: hypothetical protein A3E56_04730 [Omnitrophica WOR_2 bacterium RIFCSPHIGHO2_12_FULL_64_13]OGX35133.1 MAG: hypothetical protein A3B73_02135 [Omnitrophica WOR_2 bacterium RIFCSPHIGHO2_02_FULL_63_39]OGX45583.1 MAG: hypothetical protein A3I71_01880 [Omnitrophica WOR_2 bacterium RIFCSPLOWO2_02_FULL_63_16]OGX48465.1 MAG: hypothetical protein A3G88_06630 [Omnitrophica WOR_2 bacterium RIFCSPLOWO2_12_FULL_63_16]
MLDDMTPMERQQIVPWLVQRISQQSDVYVNSQLSELLEERLIQLGDLSSERIEALEASALSEEEIGLTGEEREHFNALVRREQASPLPEDDIRQEILGMTLDRDQPELTLNRAMELGTMIERIPDESVRLALRRTLEDKLVELQPH